MIGSCDFRPDKSVFDSFCTGWRREHIVDSPAHVILPGIAPLAPPGIVAGFSRMSGPEHVDPAIVYPVRQNVPFDWQESARLLIGLRSGEVDGFICAVGTGGTLVGVGKILKKRLDKTNIS